MSGSPAGVRWSVAYYLAHARYGTAVIDRHRRVLAAGAFVSAMVSFDSSLQEIHPKTAAGWRSWLEKNHETSKGVWLIYYRATSGKRRMSWEEAVREALCFGWIDSKINQIDDERYKQVFTPRKPKSVWSKVNKQHILELIEAGQMTDAGLRAIEVGKENGAWSFLEPIDDLIVPEDLAAALRASPNATSAYDALSTSAKRLLLYDVYSAKREETRARRIADAVSGLDAQSTGTR